MVKIVGAPKIKRHGAKHKDVAAGTPSWLAAIITAPSDEYPESYLKVGNNRERLRKS